MKPMKATQTRKPTRKHAQPINLQAFKTKACPLCNGKGLVLNHSLIGSVLGKLRKAGNISLSVMGKHLNRSAPFLHGLENGRRNWNETLIAGYLELLKLDKAVFYREGASARSANGKASK
jgi:hypothetical protein